MSAAEFAFLVELGHRRGSLGPGERQAVWAGLRALGIFDHAGLPEGLDQMEFGVGAEDPRFMAQVAECLLRLNSSQPHVPHRGVFRQDRRDQVVHAQCFQPQYQAVCDMV